MSGFSQTRFSGKPSEILSSGQASSFVINVGLGLVIAAMLARVWKARLLIQTCIVLPVVISPMAVATIWRWMYQPTGVINQLLESIGLGGLATPWARQSGCGVVRSGARPQLVHDRPQRHHFPGRTSSGR